MSIITVEIIKQGAAALDGVTPLNLAAPGVVLDRTINQTLKITVPTGLDLGTIDLSQLYYGTAPKQQGAPMLLIRATATSAGGPYIAGPINEMRRISPTEPPQTNSTLILDMTQDGGQYLGAPLLFPIGHLFSINTAGIPPLAGPHRIVLVIKPFEDEDALSAA